MFKVFTVPMENALGVKQSVITKDELYFLKASEGPTNIKDGCQEQKQRAVFLEKWGQWSIKGGDSHFHVRQSAPAFLAFWSAGLCRPIHLIPTWAFFLVSLQELMIAPSAICTWWCLARAPHLYASLVSYYGSSWSTLFLVLSFAVLYMSCGFFQESMPLYCFFFFLSSSYRRKRRKRDKSHIDAGHIGN